MLAFAAASPVFAGEAIRVVCIGDSITQGRGDHAKSGAKWISTDGWRYAFWKISVDKNVPITFVGSVEGCFESTPTYPDYKGQKFINRHEARWGWTTEGELNQLRQVQSQWKADIALIYLVTNEENLTDVEKATDPDSIARTTKAMEGIVDLLQADNPGIHIFIRELLGDDARSKGE